MHANRVVSIERLAEDLYAGNTPVTAVTQVHRQVSELRRALGESGVLIETRPPGYQIRIAPGMLDLQRFEALTAEATSAMAGGDAHRVVGALREALALWRGPALADLAYEPFAQGAIARLEELRLAALERQLEAELALGRHSAAIPELRELAGAHPLRERLRELLMVALYRSGPAGRGARRLPRDADRAGGDLRRGAGSRAAAARAGDPAPRPGARPARERPVRAGPCCSRRGTRPGSPGRWLAAPLARRRRPRELIVARARGGRGAARGGGANRSHRYGATRCRSARRRS